MAGDVDHVIHAPKNSKIAIRRLHSAVTGKVRPVTPVFALGILVVFAVILRHKAVAIAVNCLEHSWPRIPNTDVPCLTRSAFYFLAFFIKDHRINTRESRPGAARLHGIHSWLGAAKKASCLRLPPCVHDDSLAFAYDLV